jgi:hypothetical protein
MDITVLRNKNGGIHFENENISFLNPIFVYRWVCVTALERIDSSKLDFDDMTNFEKIDATNDIDFDSLKSTDLMSYYATISTKFGKMALEFYPEKAQIT